MAERLGDSRAKAYALICEIWVSTAFAPKPPHEFEKLKIEAIKTAFDTGEAFALNWTWFAIGWDEFHRGRMNDARNAAHELMRVGRLISDPESTGIGLWVLMFIALFSDSYAEALEYSEQSLAVAITPLDQLVALGGKASALALLRRVEEAVPLLEEQRRRCVASGHLYSLSLSDGIIGVCKVVQGNIKDGIRLLKLAIAKQENKGNRTLADLFRFSLAEVYLQIIDGKEKLPLLILLKNLSIILKVMATASSGIGALMTSVLENPHFDPKGFHIGRAQAILGLLYKAKKKRALALAHLTEAKRILSQFGQTPILARVDATLAELGQ